MNDLDLGIIIFCIVILTIIYFLPKDNIYVRGNRFEGKLVKINQDSKPIPKPIIRGCKSSVDLPDVIQNRRPNPPPKKRVNTYDYESRRS